MTKRCCYNSGQAAGSLIHRSSCLHRHYHQNLAFTHPPHPSPKAFLLQGLRLPHVRSSPNNKVNRGTDLLPLSTLFLLLLVLLRKLVWERLGGGGGGWADDALSGV